jgi:Tfp pilus assembly protein PilF
MKSAGLKNCAAVLLVTILAGCSGSADVRRDKFLASGNELMKKKEYARALLEFRNAAQAKPKDPEAWYQMAMACSYLEDFKCAIRDFRKTLQLNPKHFMAQLRLAQLFALTDDKQFLTEAKEKLKVLLDEQANNSDVLNTLAYANIRLGHPDLAIQGLEQALLQSPGALSSSVLLATAKLAQNDVKGAENVLVKACDEAPKSSDARLTLAEFYIAQNRVSDAENSLRGALELDSKNERARMDLGQLLFGAGRKDEAERAFMELSSGLTYRLVYGSYLYEQGRREESVREFERLVKENPEDRPARTLLVAAYRDMKRPADVDRVLQAALKKNPKDFYAKLQWAEVLLERHKLPEAETYLNQALKANRTAPEVHYLLAKLYQAKDTVLFYRQELAEALRLNPALEAVRLELAGDYINANDGHSAQVLLDEAPAPQKASAQWLVHRNWADWLQGDLKAMREGIDRGLGMNRSVDFLLQDGLWKLRAGDSAGARKSIEEALQLDPGDLRALHILKKTYIAENNMSMAVRKIKEYAAKQPKSAAVQDFLGAMLMASGDRTEARQAFAVAIASDPQLNRAEMALVQIDVADGKLEEAKTRLTSVLAKDQKNAKARRWLANIEIMRGDNNAAIEHYKQVVSAGPADPQALNNLAYLLIEYKKQPEEALTYAEKAVELAPDRPAYCDTLGWALYQKGLYANAIKYLERASASKDTAVWKYHLAMAYAKAGDRNNGKAMLAAALKANPNAPEAKLAQQVVDEVR